MERDRATTRRRLLRQGGAGLALGVGGLAGCTTGIEDRPDPQVVEVTPSDLSDVSGGEEIAASVLVHNVGSAGDVVLELETTAEDYEGAIDTATETHQVGAETQERFTVPILVSTVAERLEASAAPAAD